jgi:hypothetical protein
MISWGAKDQSEVRNYSYSWIGRLNGAEISTATLGVVDDTSDITLTNVGNTTTAIYATVSGGTNGTVAEILSTIVTNEAEPQTLTESIVLTLAPSLILNAGPSTSTKRQLVSMAYEEVALSGYEFDVTPEELFSGLRSMDAAMAMDAAQGIRLNYNFPASFGGGDLGDVSGIPDAAIEYASLRLAKALCSKMGKTLSQDGRARLSQATAMVRAFTAVVPQMPWAYGTPKGAGNAMWNGWSPFLPSPGWNE